MASAPLFSLEDLDSYDGDIDTGSSNTGTDAFATPSFVFTPQTPHQSISAFSFSPGPHRRSHPNLQHLSLAPLTPKYPITPSDYNAYIDPDTSRLHTSSSLSHIAHTPSPEGILSLPDSRSNSKMRHGKSKSSVSVQADSRIKAQGAVTSEGFGGRMMDSTDPWDTRQKSGGITAPPRNDSSWLLQTGMALTEGSRESKGQSWLAKRASSTSLHSPASEYYDVDSSRVATGWHMPSAGRKQSRDRRKGKRELAMTPASVDAPLALGDFATAGLLESQEIVKSSSVPEYAAIEPDWADPLTKAEIAADLDLELADELDDAELYPDNEDRYGLEIADQEKEIQLAVRDHGFGLGRWVDGVVDVFLKMDDADDEELALKHGPAAYRAKTAVVDKDKAKEPPQQAHADAFDDLASDDEMEPAPSNPKSVWEDIAWFGRLVLRTAKS